MGHENPGLGKEVFGTLTTARFFNVCARTVARWCDTGKLPSYQVPHSKDRRIYRKDIIALLREFGIEIPAELGGGVGLAVMLEPWEVSRFLPGFIGVGDVFGAGKVCGESIVDQAIVGDAMGLSTAAATARAILAAHPNCCVSLYVSEDAPQVIDGWAGEVIRRPNGLAMRTEAA